MGAFADVGDDAEGDTVALAFISQSGTGPASATIVFGSVLPGVSSSRESSRSDTSTEGSVFFIGGETAFGVSLRSLRTAIGAA